MGEPAFPLDNCSYKTYAVLFGGLGGASLGYNRSMIEFGGKVYKLKQLCSIDSDPDVSRYHDEITGEKTAVVMDLFTRQQYIDWHGHEPPADWREMTPWDMWVAMDYQVPYFLFTSPPCKGLSGLLPEKSAKSQKYQALNQLTTRGIDLVLRACLEYGGSVPAFIQLENVPRIQSRGKSLLAQIKKVLTKYGYAINMRGDHNLGEIGSLGQNRMRFLIMARQESQAPIFMNYPARKKLRTIGDVIGPLPLPGNTEDGGPQHKLPQLQWKTWIRLALIKAGGDWRDLQEIPFEEYRIVHEPRGGAYAVEDWNDPSRTVTGAAGPGRSNGATAVSDPRFGFGDGTHQAIYRVSRHDEPGPTVTGAHRPNNGAICVSDPRLNEREGRHPGVYRVVRSEETAPCITGTRFGSGALAVSDARLGDKAKFNHAYKVSEWDEVGGTVASGGGPSNGGHVVADPRVNTKLHPDSYGVQDWDKTSKSIRSASRIMQSASSISDPRLSDLPKRYTDKYRMQSMEEPAATVTGVTDVQSGAQLVADVRLGCSPRSGSYGVQAWDDVGKTVTGSGDIHSGAFAVADPRPFPEDKDRGVWTIISEDGTVHRPLTTYELAMLQGFPTHLPDGRPFQLEGCSDAKAREYIGNAVPPPSAQAMGNEILLAAAQAEVGESFSLSWNEVWVAPIIDELAEAVLH
ncbi:DNA cytosine methyltransferase [Cohnella yongneupensis]|uniref:DNA (cytosine-5-)-methyltransferase n=1 Tax=Cohnella yongneupensis TaxID=425006 RepID=A0ABW0QTX3_9BACL